MGEPWPSSSTGGGASSGFAFSVDEDGFSDAGFREEPGPSSPAEQLWCRSWDFCGSEGSASRGEGSSDATRSS